MSTARIKHVFPVRATASGRPISIYVPRATLERLEALEARLAERGLSLNISQLCRPALEDAISKLEADLG